MSEPRVSHIDELGDGLVRKLRSGLGVEAFGVNAWVLEPGTEIRRHRHERQDELYLALMIMSSFIFSTVVVFLGYSMWKFRVPPDDDQDGPGHFVRSIVKVTNPTRYGLTVGNYFV